MNEPYVNARAAEAAIRDAARKASSADKSTSIQDRIRQEYFRRFLSRVFSEQEDSGWILKGGTGVLARVPSARHTTDVDLFQSKQTIDEALQELIRLVSIDLGDHFRFIYAKQQPKVGGQQAHIYGLGVYFDVYIGVDKKGALHVDLVTGTRMTDEPTLMAPANQLNLPRLVKYDYRLYPIVDQLADKVCATMASYNGKPSSREKDLIDIVILATTQVIKADSLRRAIDTEARHRAIAPFIKLNIPPSWGRVYSREAREIPLCADYRTIGQVNELILVFIDQVLEGGAVGMTWSPTARTWE